MSVKCPDKWLVIRMETAEHGRVDKVLGTWNGSYLGSSSWQLSSGNREITEYEDRYEITQSSGSLYVLNKQCRGIRHDWEHLLGEFKEGAEKLGASFEILENVN